MERMKQCANMKHSRRGFLRKAIADQLFSFECECGRYSTVILQRTGVPGRPFLNCSDAVSLLSVREKLA